MSDTTVRPRRSGPRLSVAPGWESAAPWVGGALLAALLGAALAGQTDAYVGKTPSLLLVAAVCGAATFVLFGAIGYPAFLAWPVLTGIAYPFVRYPSGDPLVTFDRLWIVGLLGVIMLATTRVDHARQTRFLLVSVAALTAVFGARALATQADTLFPVKVWVDAIVLPLILLVATVRLATSERRIVTIAGSMMVGGTMLALIGMADLAAGLDLESRVGGERREELGIFRLSGPYGVPEPYGLALVICLAATCYWFFARAGGARVVATLLGLIQLAAIGLTLFRAVWISAALVIITTFGLRRGRLGRLVFVASIMGLLVLGAGSQLTQSSLVSERLDNTDNIWGRLATYEQGIDIFRDAPLFGVGVDQYHDYAEELRPATVKGVESVTHPHSTFVGILAEQGLVGFVTLLVVCFAIWRLLRALSRTATDPRAQALAGAGTGAALGLLVMSLTLTMLPYGPSNAFLAILLGLVAAQLNLTVRDRPETPG